MIENKLNIYATLETAAALKTQLKDTVDKVKNIAISAHYRNKKTTSKNKQRVPQLYNIFQSYFIFRFCVPFFLPVTHQT